MQGLLSLPNFGPVLCSEQSVSHSVYFLDQIQIETVIGNDIFSITTIILTGAPNIYKLKLHENISIVLSRLKMATASQIPMCILR